LKNSIEVRPEGNTIVVSSNKVYAAVHNFSGKVDHRAQGRNQSMNIPARPFLVIQKETLEEIRDVIADSIS
jgi:phage gpG-like protein